MACSHTYIYIYNCSIVLASHCSVSFSLLSSWPSLFPSPTHIDTSFLHVCVRMHVCIMCLYYMYLCAFALWQFSLFLATWHNLESHRKTNVKRVIVCIRLSVYVYVRLSYWCMKSQPTARGTIFEAGGPGLDEEVSKEWSAGGWELSRNVLAWPLTSYFYLQV